MREPCQSTRPAPVRAWDGPRLNMTVARVPGVPLPCRHHQLQPHFMWEKEKRSLNDTSGSLRRSGTAASMPLSCLVWGGEQATRADGEIPLST